MPRSLRSSRLLAAAAAALVASSAASHADVIWSDDFTGNTNNTFPVRNYTGTNAPNDWMNQGTETMVRVSTSVGNSAPALVLTDASTGGMVNLKLQMDDFAAFSTATAPILRLSFDLKIESFLGSSTAVTESFRVILRANNSNASGDQLIIGFNRADLNDGDASAADLALYAGTVGGSSNVTLTNSNVIGLNQGTGWQPGFNFGEYNGSSAAANDTDDLFYHFDLGYNRANGAVNGTATRVAADATNGQSASFSVALNSGLIFSNDPSDVLIFATTTETMSTAQVDNIVLESVPEPGSAALLALGSLGFAAIRRRRSERA